MRLKGRINPMGATDQCSFILMGKTTMPQRRVKHEVEVAAINAACRWLAGSRVIGPIIVTDPKFDMREVQNGHFGTSGHGHIPRTKSCMDILSGYAGVGCQEGETTN